MNELQNKYVNIDDIDVNEVITALKSSDFSGKSPVVEKFEEKLKAYFSSKFALCCSNATLAIYQALMALGVRAGDEVLLPPTGPIMTVLPIIALGAVPVFVDTVSDSCFAISLDDVKKKMSSKTKCIISVPMWGYPFEGESLVQFARDNNIFVIEDCSHAHGSKYQDRYLGTCGDIGIFSTQERKLICTGEGAFILVNDAGLYVRLKELQMFGIFSAAKPEFSEYMVKYGSKFGLNFKINPMAAALGCSQLEKLEKKISRRGENARQISSLLKDIECIEELPQDRHGRANYYAIVMRVRENPHGDASVLARHMSRHNVISDTYRYNCVPLYQMPLFSAFTSPCPHAEQLLKNIVTLPTHEGLTEADIQQIVESVKTFFHLLPNSIP